MVKIQQKDDKELQEELNNNKLYVHTDTVKLYFAKYIYAKSIDYNISTIRVYRHKETGEYYLKQRNTETRTIFEDDEKSAFRKNLVSDDTYFLNETKTDYTDKEYYKSLKEFARKVEYDITCLFKFESSGYIPTT